MTVAVVVARGSRGAPAAAHVAAIAAALAALAREDAGPRRAPAARPAVSRWRLAGRADRA